MDSHQTDYADSNGNRIKDHITGVRVVQLVTAWTFHLKVGVHNKSAQSYDDGVVCPVKQKSAVRDVGKDRHVTLILLCRRHEITTVFPAHCCVFGLHRFLS